MGDGGGINGRYRLSTVPLPIVWNLSRVKPPQFSFQWLQPSSGSAAITSESRVTQLDSNTRNTVESPMFPLTAGTSTEQLHITEYLGEQITDLYNAANGGLFEDEQIRSFSQGLSSLLNKFGDATITELAPFIIGEKASAESAAETLKCLSRYESRVAYNYRIWIMERALQSPSSWIRDAAGLALESMDDPTAIPYLKEAISKESNAGLCQYLQMVVEYLSRKR